MASQIKTSNIDFSKMLILELARQGVRSFCLCAGARNAPLVKTLVISEGLELHSFFEERSAAFFALGRAKRDRSPVAVVTTSGTAVAELLPATIEAHYSGVPLVLVTADRPKSFRHSGAPQAILQEPILKPYAQPAFDWEAKNGLPDFRMTNPTGPTHINVCVDEPLIDGTLENYKVSPVSIDSIEKPVDASQCLSQWENFRSAAKNPLIVAGPMNIEQAQVAAKFIETTGCSLYLEATSNVKGFDGRRVAPHEVSTGKFDGVLRLGGVPTARFWRDLEGDLAHLLVFSVDDVDFSGLAREESKAFPLSVLPVLSELPLSGDAEPAAPNRIWESYPLSEPAWVHRVSELLPAKTRVFLGNSLPIREWDLVGAVALGEVCANRGANGIDGLVSSFLGWAQESVNNIALIGDLSALYDLAGLSLSKEDMDLTIFLINNGGGKIFDRVFKDATFENSHNLEFSHWAKMFGWNYHLWSELDHSTSVFEGKNLVEIQPDTEQSQKFWRAYDSEVGD